MLKRLIYAITISLISVLTVSRSGKYLASGQKTHVMNKKYK